MWRHRDILVLSVVIASFALGCHMAVAAGPSRLSVDFSSTLITDVNVPAHVLADMAKLYRDMAADGVNNVCSGRLPSHVCNPTIRVGIDLPLLNGKLNLDLPAERKLEKLANLNLQHVKGSSVCQLCDNRYYGPQPCSCAAPGGKTRCTCQGTLTGKQYFDAANYDLELAYVLVKAVNETNTISGGINANFNSTVRLKNSILFVDGRTGSGDLELDESHLDLMKGSQIVMYNDADMEVEDNGSLWMSGGSKIVLLNTSNIQTQLAHILMEEGSVMKIAGNSSWNMTQEADMTPAQADAVCNTPFQPNAAAEWCFHNKEECTKRADVLSVQELQALTMLRYPPALDRWGRQAFDYSDDNTYDDYYDFEYVDPKLEAGPCLGPDVCSIGSAKSKPNRGRHMLSAAPLPTAATPAEADDADSDSDYAMPPPSNSTSPIAADSDDDDDGDNDSDDDNDDDHSKLNTSTEINAKDTLDGLGYDPAWGEGPYGETLCDAPPFKSFNYYGMIVRSGSRLVISGNSSWVAQDSSRMFVRDSSILLEGASQLYLMNSTLVLINSNLTISGESAIILERFSSLQLYNSRVFGDSAMYAPPANSTWQGQPWVQRGDYRASPGGGLPVFMGAKEGVQLGTFKMGVSGFDLEARMLPPAGCSCKAPKVATYLTAPQ